MSGPPLSLLSEEILFSHSTSERRGSAAIFFMTFYRPGGMAPLVPLDPLLLLPIVYYTIGIYIPRFRRPYFAEKQNKTIFFLNIFWIIRKSGLFVINTN